MSVNTHPASAERDLLAKLREILSALSWPIEFQIEPAATDGHRFDAEIRFRTRAGRPVLLAVECKRELRPATFHPWAERVAALAARASQLGRRFGVPDLEAVGLGMEGLALVCRGEVEDGMRLLDESSAIATAENMRLPLSSGWALCCVLSACEGIGDFRRATQWCEAIRRFERQQILEVLRLTQFDKKEAARRLGLSLASLYRKLEGNTT